MVLVVLVELIHSRVVSFRLVVVNWVFVFLPLGTIVVVSCLEPALRVLAWHIFVSYERLDVVDNLQVSAINPLHLRFSFILILRGLHNFAVSLTRNYLSLLWRSIVSGKTVSQELIRLNRSALVELIG